MAKVKDEQVKNELVELVNGVESEIPEWMQKSNEGSEEVSASDLIIPRIDVLQALSPQIKKTNEKYIEGAEEGMIFNTVTNQLFGNSILMVPCFFRKEYVVWKERKSGGGFFGSFKTELEGRQAISEMEVPSQYDCFETHQHFILVVHEGEIQEAVLSLSRTKLKASRSINTMVQMAGVARFGKAYRLTAIDTSNAKGEFWTFRVDQAGWCTKELYERGEKLYQAVKSGEADVSRVYDDDASVVEVHESAEL